MQILLVARLLSNLMEIQSQRLNPKFQIYVQLNQIYPRPEDNLGDGYYFPCSLRPRTHKSL